MEYYDKQGKKISLSKWAELFEDIGYKIIDNDVIGKYFISTVWIGLELSFTGDSSKEIFETAVFKDGKIIDKYMTRYSSAKKAAGGHYNICVKLSKDVTSSIDEYYKPPEDDVFEDIKKNAIEIWETYDDNYGYVTEKIDRIKLLKNRNDNALYIFNMFDSVNQNKMLNKLSKKSTKFLNTQMRMELAEEQKDNKVTDEKIERSVKMVIDKHGGALDKLSNT